ncbi:MAG TPA: hypothetical protein EYN66_02595 [Myxococcales bacterium]|nr:hypothetical protein [Myxococcales bacterium]
MRTLITVAIALTSTLMGCQLEQSSHPLAVAAVSPTVICAGDQFATPISLSAKASMAIAKLPGVTQDHNHCITAMTWELVGASFELLEGNTHCSFTCNEDTVDCPIQIALEGNTTALIQLTVENDLGDSDFAVVPILVTSDCPPADAIP